MEQITKKSLQEKYVQYGSIRAVADDLGLPNSSIRLLFKKYEIAYQANPSRRAQERIIIDGERLKEKYVELQSIEEVANYFGVSRSKIKKSFRKFDITYDKFIKAQFNEQMFGQDTPESFYLAGFIAADGNINNNTLQISLSVKDATHLQKIKDVMKFDGNLRVVKGSPSYIDGRKINGGDTIRLICTAIEMKRDLERFNVVPNKSKIYDLPEWFMSHPLQSHFMRGYFDGDGHIGIIKLKTQNKLRWALVGNVWFLEKCQQILERECGIEHNNIYKRTDTFGKLEYRGNLIVPKICQFLYNNSTFHMDRKYNIYKDWLNND